MRKVFGILAVFFTMSFSAPVCSAQINQERSMATLARERAERQKELEKRSGARQAARTVSVDMIPLLFGRRLSKEQKIRLAPAKSDSDRYANFLRQSKTGLIKLFPDLGCEENANVVRADETCLQWIPNSAFYSFREKEHTSDFLADLRLEKGVLVSDGFLSQSILVNLGAVDLETVTGSSGGMKFLNEFEPASESKIALEQVKQIIKGVKAENYIYKKSLPAVENATYALRVIAYRANLWRSYRGQLFNVLAGDKRIDQTIAFRVTGKNDDGSLTLLWKELSRKEAPKVSFQKRK